MADGYTRNIKNWAGSGLVVKNLSSRELTAVHVQIAFIKCLPVKKKKKKI